MPSLFYSNNKALDIKITKRLL